MNFEIHTPTEEEKKAALDSFFEATRASRSAAAQAEKDLYSHSTTLIKALQSASGQGEKVSRIIRSVWNGCHPVGLGNDLCGLDHAIGAAVLALIAARIHMGGNADELIRAILVESGEYQRLCDDMDREAAASES